MWKPIPGVIALTLVLSGCDASDVASRQNSHQPALDGLPLTAESRSVLADDLTQLAAPSMQEHCTPDEIAFLDVSLTAFAVGVDAPLTEPWSSAQQARFDALMARWQAMGGDARDVSEACHAHIRSLGIPL